MFCSAVTLGAGADGVGSVGRTDDDAVTGGSATDALPAVAA